MLIPALLQSLAELNGLRALNFFSPPPVELIQKRLAGDDSGQATIAKALSLRESTGLPFWDCANLNSFGMGKQAVGLVEQALFHNSDETLHWTLSKEELTDESLHALFQSLPINRMFVLSSRVEMDGDRIGHIPMLDFHCPAGPSGQELVEICIRKLCDDGGWLVASGKSYHFYGRRLISELELQNFLARALLLSPITDRAWIAHQLIERCCGLRISQRHADEHPPRVISEVAR